MKIALLREAGGLGDVVMTEPVIRGLRAEFPRAEIWYAGLPEYAGIASRFRAPPTVYYSVPRHERRDRDAAPDGERWPYLRPLLDADRVVSLFCPAFQHERERRHRTGLSRVELFCRAGGVQPTATGRGGFSRPGAGGGRSMANWWRWRRGAAGGGAPGRNATGGNWQNC